MIFGKLKTEKQIEYFRQPLKVDGEDIFTNDKDLLLRYGWKEVVFTTSPETKEGFYADSHYEETNTQIIQKWEILPIEEGDDLNVE